MVFYFLPDQQKVGDDKGGREKNSPLEVGFPVESISVSKEGGHSEKNRTHRKSKDLHYAFGYDKDGKEGILPTERRLKAKIRRGSYIEGALRRGVLGGKRKEKGSLATK